MLPSCIFLKLLFLWKPEKKNASKGKRKMGKMEVSFFWFCIVPGVGGGELFESTK